MADINRFCLLSPDWKTFWARIFQTWIFFTGAKWVTLSFTAYNNQEIFFFLEQTAVWIQVNILLMPRFARIRSVGLWVYLYLFKRPRHWAFTLSVSLKCKSFFTYCHFLYFGFVGYTTVHCLSPLFAFVHNDCSKCPVMKAKDAIEIYLINLCI